MVQKQARRRYTIAWICPLVVEYNAAKQMLDENHGIPSHLSTDSNAYTLGSIHGHNVVLLILGETGSVPAAYAVARMRKAFPEIEHGLLVGIGGGVPAKTDNGDIRLGDVVVGTPAGVHPGTVRYDQGKAGTEGLTRTGCLSRPPAIFLTATKRLAAIRSAKDLPDPIYQNLRRLEARGPTRGQLHPGKGHDRLYAPDYNHITSGVPCTDCGCDTRRLVHRAQRDDVEESSYSPVVHGETIATGEMIIKDAATRDQLAQEFGAVCFETEAAGVLYDLPCLVIRGISDYCDSHKDRQWHKYAAATAAAYARALLEQVPYQGAKRSPEGEIIERKQRLLIATWMSPMMYERQQQYLRSIHMERTGLWLFEDKNLIEWLDVDRQKSTLLFSGGPGAGKTVMVSSVIQHLQVTFSAEPLVATAYVYCDGRKAEQSPLKLLMSLSKQLYAGLNFTPECISELHRQCVEQRKLPKYGQIVRALTLLSNLYERVFIIVDAVDEILDAEKAENFLATLADIQANANVNILLTWREIPNIEHLFGKIAKIEIRASKSDLETYLGQRIDRVNCLCGDALTQQQVKTSLLRVLEKTPRFLLAHLYMELLQGCSYVTEVIEFLQETAKPDDYHDVYTKIMEKIEKQSGDKRQISTYVLEWLSCAMGCLTLPDLQYAITLQAKLDDKNIPMIKDSTAIVSACLGLVTVNPVEDAVQLVHATAYDYFHRSPTELKSTAHYKISQTCMEYLSNHERFPKMAGTERFSPGLFHEYAAQNWGHHARMSATSLTDAVVKFMADENLVKEISRHIFAPKFDHEPTQVQATGMTNIHLAAYFGLHDSLQVMIQAREKLPWFQRVMNRLFRGPLGLDSKDSCGRTPLSYAAEKGTPATIKLLIARGANADLRDRTGRTPLSWAAESNNHAALSELLWPAQIDAKDDFGKIPLSWAAGNGCSEAVEKLMEAGSGTLAAGFEFRWADKPSLSEDEPSGGTPLIWASSNGHLHVAKYLLDKNASVEGKDLNGRAALSWAAGNGHAALVRSLLRCGSDPKATDKKKRDALMWAAAHGHLPIASHLLQSAASFKARDVTGRTALSLAAENGQNALVALLLERGAPPDDQDDEGRTPLFWAAEGGHRTASKSLLDYHAALDHRDKNGRTALSRAAGRGQVKAVELLINQGANLEIPDRSGRNALSWAAGNGQTEMVLFLVDIADSSLLSATDTSGLNFFLWAARNGQNRIVSLLLDQLEYDFIHTPTNKGENALFVACQYGRTEVVETFLRENSFSIYESDHRGLTSLMVAALQDKFEVVDLLLDHGAPVNALDADMQTVLHHAAYRGNLQFARLFLKRGASLEIQDNLGRSPLLIAAKENREAIASLLLTSGARVDCQDYDGQTPLHWAVINNNVRMAHWFLRRGANVYITNKQGLTPEAQARRLGDQAGDLRRLFWNNSYRRARAWSSSTESLSSVNSH